MGATGLVGRHVVEALERDLRHRIVATYHVRKPYDADRVSWLKCDLRDPEQAMGALQSVESAVLCAGQLSTSAVLNRDPITSVLSTLRIFTNLLEAAARLRLKRIVLISSCTGYPSLQRPAVEADMAVADPPAQWFGVGWMHRYVEQQLRWYVEHLGLIESAVVLRPTLVFGPYDDFSPETGHFVPALIRKVVERVRPIDIWGDGSQERNLLHAGDLAEAVIAALSMKTPGVSAFNVASPAAMSVNEVLQHLVEIDGFSDAVLVHDLKRGGGPSALRVSGDALAAATGWQAKRGGRQGLADTLSWYRQARAGFRA